jgi:hypothetical protein
MASLADPPNWNFYFFLEVPMRHKRKGPLLKEALKWVGPVLAILASQIKEPLLAGALLIVAFGLILCLVNLD